MGTTNFVVRYDGGCLIASDTRTTRGAFIEDRNARKMNDISPSTANFGGIWVVRCGNAAHSQVLTRYAYNYLTYHAMELSENDSIKLETLANIFQSITYNNKEHLSASFILTNGNKIMSVHKSGAVFDHQLFYAQGSGSTYIDGFLKTNLRPGLPYAAVEKICAQAMALAINSDTASGGNLTLVDIKEDGSSTTKVIFNDQLRDLLTPK